MEPKIEAGSVVMLNSGGPKMTVGYIKEVDGIEEAMCYWIPGPDRPRFWKFPVSCLMIVL